MTDSQIIQKTERGTENPAFPRPRPRPSPTDDDWVSVSLYSDDGKSNQAKAIQFEKNPDSDDSSNIVKQTVDRGVNPAASISAIPDPPKYPSKALFLCRVYVLVFVLILVALVQWISTTYRWRPQITDNERYFFVLMMTLAFLNMTFTIFCFRRLQSIRPINWLVFGCIAECLVLIFAVLCIKELDLTWEFLLVGGLVLVVYTGLGLFTPPKLTGPLWNLILASMFIVIASILVFITCLTMRIYVPLCCCLLVFGPWAMHNSQIVHGTGQEGFHTNHHLQAALIMFINFACTVGGTSLITRFATELIEAPACRDKIFCKGTKSVE